MPSPALLDRLGTLLDAADVAWKVLDEEPDEDRGDGRGPAVTRVTLFVADVDAAAAALDLCCFARPHRDAPLLAPDDDGRWLAVDLVTGPPDGPTAGPTRPLRTPAAAWRLRPARRGLSVALLGPDGVGKSTVTAGVTDAYPLPAEAVYMGMWQGADRPGRTPLDAAAAALLRPLRSGGRALAAALHVARGRLVVFDRYTYDALLPITGTHRVLKRPYFWLLAHTAPRPDLVIVLDLPGEVAFARKGEFTPEELETARQGFLALVPRMGAEVVDAAAPPERVRVDVTARVWRHHRERLIRPGR